ncbi:MAG TPA: polysaccharide biosynthesis C-terminal domain-containing protein [Chitinophagaceae bacterium]
MRLQKLIYQGIVWRGLYYASVFILNIVIARVYKAEDSGLINYLINNLSFLLLITSLSLESALGYFGSRNEISPNKLTTLGLVVAITSALVSTGAILLFSQRQPSEMNSYYILLAFIYVLGVVLTNYFSSLYYAKQRVVLPNAILMIVNLLVLMFALYEFGVEQHTAGKTIFLYVYFASFLIQGLILFFSWTTDLHGFGQLRLPSSVEMKMLFNYAFAALLANVIFFLVYRVDYWFVKAFCTDAQLGNYIQVSKLGQIFLLLPSIIATAVFTRTAGGRHDQTRNVIEIISRWLLLLYIILVIVIIITGNWLFPALYGQSFNLMYGPFLLLSPGILSLCTLSLLTAFNAGRNRMGINIRGSAIAFIVIVAGNFMFIPLFGIYAAALVSSIGYICFQVYVLNQFRKEYNSNVFDFFIPKSSDWNIVKQFFRQHETN